MVGQYLSHYYIHSKIGEGGSSTVYRGQDVRLNRPVAVKVLKQDSGDAAFGRLLEEARIVSTMSHPNVCCIYDMGEEKKVYYIVLEFIKGKTLEAILNSGPLPIRTVMDYGIQIADAMTYAHRRGILHEDLSSSNIMVTPLDQIKVLDFGSSKWVGTQEPKHDGDSERSSSWSKRMGGAIPHVPGALADERSRIEQFEIRSLGIILFEMLTGQLPSCTGSPFGSKIENMTDRRGQQFFDLPPALRAIVQRCLEKDWECAYNSTLEVLNHLRSEFESFKTWMH